jgi:hypothetical protein
MIIGRRLGIDPATAMAIFSTVSQPGPAPRDYSDLIKSLYAPKWQTAAIVAGVAALAIIGLLIAKGGKK